ncbi:MAG: MBOAT family protein [Bacteroidia bacterium]|nr:MBOAT family protein [Bacteroidia bacterium]
MDFLDNILLYQVEKPLLFTQLYFWGFFTIVLAGYSIIYRNKAIRNAYLLIVSLFFYYKTGGYFFSLLLFATVVDYFLALGIYRSQRESARKLLVALTFISNLGVLAYFKYAYFFVDITNQLIDLLNNNNIIFLPHFEVVNLLALWSNTLTGTHFDVATIILPVGISFYTFQSISYTVDVYRNKVAPARNIIDFAFYISFFPQLVAGPIVRAAEFMPQLYQDYRLTSREMGHALFLILNGLIKKMVISDYISINFVDRIFESPLSYSGFENLMAVYGYSIQIYCDFSGYTDIAIGVALLMGIRLPLNFYSPYKADSITDFWRRWHISLSTWLRDYLYIPIGGSKKGFFRTQINLLITMLLGGLWHGANVRFIVWGGLHGLALVGHKLWLKFSPLKAIKSRFARFVAISSTFHFVTFTWIFFRNQDMNYAKQMISRIIEFFTDNDELFLVPKVIFAYKEVFFLIIMAFVLHWLPSEWKEQYRGWFIKTPIYVKGIIIVLIVFFIYQIKSSDIQPFIYFKF